MSLRKLNKTIKVTTGVLRKLEKLKKRFRVRAINDVIVGLLKAYEEYEILKEMQKTEAKIEIPTPYLASSPEKEAKGQIPENKCIYRCFNEKEGLVYCAKDFLEKGKMHKVTPQFCQTCWELQLKKKREKEEKQKEREISLIKRNIHYYQERIRKRLKEEEEKQKEAPFYCALKNQGFKDISKLPCLENPMFKCPNEKCHKKVLEMIK